jgi:curved DNA-binding protein CbpA
MMMKWFKNPQTLEELKKQYKRLVTENHPDKGGKTEDMQEINAEYDTLFAKLKNIHRTADGQTYTKETSETKDEYKNILNKLVSIEDINIEICGSWIWITGNTYSRRNILKELKFKFSNNKKAWYYHEEGYRKHGNKSFTLDEIRDFYGSETVAKKVQYKLA